MLAFVVVVFVLSQYNFFLDEKTYVRKKCLNNLLCGNAIIKKMGPSHNVNFKNVLTWIGFSKQ